MKAYARQCAKAVMGGVVAALGAGVTATLEDDRVSTGEWWAIASAGAAAAYAVWQTSNGPEYAAKHAAE